jgi:hypothetical protein
MRGTMAALVCAAWPLAAVADDHPVVVELFTSQGCSTCPPADEMLGQLARMPGVIALGLHVDYWDYIGWKDTFASPGLSARQELYARAAGERGVYTPQFIVGGVDPVVGANAMEVMTLVSRHAAVATGVTLEIAREGGVLRIAGRTAAPVLRPMMVQLVRYRPAETVEIGAGENAGHRIAYSNIVTSWETLAEWLGTAPFEMQIEIAGPEPVVVIVQEIGPGRIMAAAEIE